MTPNLFIGARTILANERGPHVSAIMADLANDIRAEDRKTASDLERAGKKLFEAWFDNDPMKQGDAQADALDLVERVLRSNRVNFGGDPMQNAGFQLKQMTESALALDPLTGLSDPVAMHDTTAVRANWLTDLVKGGVNVLTGGVSGSVLELAQGLLQGSKDKDKSSGVSFGGINTAGSSGIDYAGQIQTILNDLQDPDKKGTKTNPYPTTNTSGGGEIVRHSDMELLFGPLMTAPNQSVRYVAPRGYVVVTLPLNHPYANDVMATGGVKHGNGIKIAIQKEAAKDFKLWKPRAKPLITASQARTIQKAHTLEKKLARVTAKAGVTVSQAQVNRAKR